MECKLTLDWLVEKAVERLVLVITDIDSGQVMERWQFIVQLEGNASEESAAAKSEKQIQQEIQAIIRQITASVTFLPLLEHKCIAFC